MMKLIALLLLGLVSLVEGEVVDSFAVSCPKFFIKDQNKRPVTPTVLGKSRKRDHKGKLKVRYRQICQNYKNSYWYATLYDTRNRIPVYSAYLYTGHESVDRKSGAWMIEPGLDIETEMTTEAKAKAGGAVGTNQAVNDDYKYSGYQKGHLYPVCQNCDQDQSDSTFTLTNAAPQKKTDNLNWYLKAETAIINYILNECEDGSTYVVTGVVPGDVWLEKENQERVNVPGCFWSAFCCRHRLTEMEYSRGFLAPTDSVAEEMSVQELNAKLTDKYTTQFKVFGDQCLNAM